jgi:hypothetical protein
VPGEVNIKTAANHHPNFVDIVEGIGHQAMVAYQNLKKRGKMIAPHCELWAEGEVGKSGVVNSSRKRSFPAAPVGAGIKSQSEPIIEVIGNAGARASRI